jgi:hypothetical protein
MAKLREEGFNLRNGGMQPLFAAYDELIANSRRRSTGRTETGLGSVDDAGNVNHIRP